MSRREAFNQLSKLATNHSSSMGSSDSMHHAVGVSLHHAAEDLGKMLGGLPSVQPKIDYHEMMWNKHLKHAQWDLVFAEVEENR